MRPLARLLPLAFAVAAIVACDAVTPGEISTGIDGLRTFTYRQSVNGTPILCTLEAAVDPVVGTLAGDPQDKERVWLETIDGRRLSVVWPQGFRVGFEPAAVLYNENGTAVAGAGDTIELGQVNVADHLGTFADPYFARGLVLGGCYPVRL